MPIAQHPELLWLTLTCALTALMWIPYILQFLAQEGVVKAILDGSGVHDHNAEWANRAKRAHHNALENLVVFAPLVLTIVVLDIGDPLTELTALIFFAARIAHYVIYLAGLPLVRTLAFAVGWGAQLVLILRILGVI